MTSLLVIFYQDQKDRMVFWWLFVSVAISLSILHIARVGSLQYGIHIAFNTSIVLIMLLILRGYIKIRMQTARLQEVLGLGDIFFLFAIALGFSTVSFVTLLVFGLLFSLLIHLVLQGGYLRMLSRKRSHEDTPIATKSVPLAGYLSLFFAGVLLVDWLGLYENLYMI